MKRRPLSDLAVGLLLKVALDRLSHDGPPVDAGQRASGRASSARPSQPESPPSRPLKAFMFASLAVALVLMLLFHATITRVVGVAALFAFIISGVFLIADHAFLGPEEDHESVTDRSPG